MAITVDKSSIGFTFSNPAAPSISFNTNQTVAANAFIAVCIGWFDPVLNLSTVAGGSLSWTIDKQGRGVVDETSGNAAVASAQAPSGLASGTTITATFAGDVAGIAIGGTSFLGVKTSSPVDGTPTRADNGGDPWSTPSYPVQSGSAIVACCYAEPNIGSSPTAPSVEAWEAIDPGGNGTVSQYRLVSSAGSFTVAGTWAGAFGSINVAVAYLAAPTGTSVLVPRHALGGGRW